MERWRLRGLDLSRGQERARFGRVIEATMGEVIRPIIYREALDLMIAAVARVHGASVVTRNVADFENCGVPIINPWAA